MRSRRSPAQGAAPALRRAWMTTWFGVKYPYVPRVHRAAHQDQGGCWRRQRQGYDGAA
jgi:hypothetical protein